MCSSYHFEWNPKCLMCTHYDYTFASRGVWANCWFKWCSYQKRISVLVKYYRPNQSKHLKFRGSGLWVWSIYHVIYNDNVQIQLENHIFQRCTFLCYDFFLGTSHWHKNKCRDEDVGDMAGSTNKLYTYQQTHMADHSKCRRVTWNPQLISG